MKITAHLSDQAILLALDGELSSREATRMRIHLEACWGCRARCEQIKQVINSVGEYQNNDELVNELLPRPWHRRTEFIQRLDQLIEKTVQPSFPQLMIASLWRVRWQVSIGAFALAVLLFAVRQLEKPPGVSASELLRRADASEHAQLSGINHPVIYRKVRIRTGNQTVTRVTYRDAVSRRVVDRTDPPNPSLMAAAFTRAGFDWQEPLSAADFSAWRGRLSEKTDEVRPEGRDSLVLLTSTPDGLVQQARLTVRASDCHPIAEQLHFYDSKELEMTELDFRVLSMDAIGPGIFEPLASRAVPAAREEVAKAVDAIPEASKEPTPTELGDAEMQARVVLHAARADVGEDIAVLRSPSEVLVRGVVETPERKQELIAALTKIAHIQTRVQTLAEATPSQPELSSAAPAVETQMTDSPLFPPLLQETLERQFPNIEDRSGFINQALDMAQVALAHASALRNLGTRYGSSPAELSPDSRRELAKLLLDHAVLLRQQLLSERELISAVLPAAAGATVVKIPRGMWEETVAEVLPDVREIHSDVVALFANSGTPVPDASSTVAKLRIATAHLEALLSSLSEQVNAQLLSAERGTNK